jgi:hypothetical protein
MILDHVQGHFVSRQLHRNMAVAPYNQRVMVIEDSLHNNVSFAMTVLTALDEDFPVVAKVIDGRNDQVQFLATIVQLIEARQLVDGDTLCMGK